MSEGCYLLRTNVTDWSDEELWKTYIQLTQLVDVILPNGQDTEIRKRCITRPTDHQAILLQRLSLYLPDKTTY